MTTIWRLESERGVGIYNTSLCNEIQADFEDCNFYNRQRQPMPCDDPKMCKAWNAMEWREKEKWFFGFSSIRTYVRWFHGLHARRWFANHKEQEIVLSRYEVPRRFVIKGEYQAVFRMREAELMERYRPDVV